MGVFDKKGIFESLKDAVGLSEEARLVRKAAKLEQQIVDEPRNLEVWEQLRQCYEALGQTQDQARCCFRIGNIYFSMQYYDTALRYYEMADSLFGEPNIPLLKQKALACINVQKLEDAYHTARTVIKEYVNRGERDAALGFLRLLPSLGPSNNKWRRELAELIPGNEGKTGSLVMRTSWRAIPKYVPQAVQQQAQVSESSSGELLFVEPKMPFMVSAFYSKLFESDLDEVVEEVEEDAAVSQEVALTTKLAGMKILVIVRDERFRNKLMPNLMGLGAEILEAVSTEVAKQFFSYELPSMVLVHTLPGDWEWYQIYTFVIGFCETEDIPVICLAETRDEQQMIQALDAGVADYWVWPLSRSELSSRLLRIYHRSSEESSGISGSLAEISLPDVLQLLEGCRKTGVLTVKCGSEFGSFYFNDGRVVDARYKRWDGELAFYRLLKWTEGFFRFSPRPPIETPENITDSVQGMLMEAMRRMDEQEKLLPNLPPRELVLHLRPVNSRTTLLNPAYPRLMALIDGQKTVADCLEDLNMDPEAMELMINLYGRGVLCTVDQLDQLPDADKSAGVS